MEHDWIATVINMWSDDWDDTIVTLLEKAKSSESALRQRMLTVMPDALGAKLGPPRQECSGYKCANCGVVLATSTHPTIVDLEALGISDCAMLTAEKVMRS